ncbi:MAG: hypothetical protein PWP30_1305 [Eubacteriaceae bacterium]|nr:hypothetical protein [Eubacteriaceae bacterium]
MNNIEFVPVINIFTGVTESYHSQNVVIVYESTFNKNEVMQSEAVESYEAIQLYYQVAKEINSVVFENLNNGQTVTYYGESEHWQGTAVLKYYNNSIEDENGKLHMDTYSWESEEVKYLGDVSDITGAITVEYSHGASKGSRTGERLDQTGELQLGSTGGNGAIPPAEQPVVFTVKWNDQEESFSAEVVEMSDMD